MQEESLFECLELNDSQCHWQLIDQVNITHVCSRGYRDIPSLLKN